MSADLVYNPDAVRRAQRDNLERRTAKVQPPPVPPVTPPPKREPRRRPSKLP